MANFVMLIDIRRSQIRVLYSVSERILVRTVLKATLGANELHCAVSRL